jgi:hypothetical protein
MAEQQIPFGNGRKKSKGNGEGNSNDWLAFVPSTRNRGWLGTEIGLRGW